MKKIISVLLSLVFILTFISGCGYEYADIEYEGEYSRDLAGTVLNVYNWGEYISDGSEGTIDVNREFEKLTGIKVNYVTFESNETMYSQLKSGGVSYDIIVPSDYMIARLKSEDMLRKIDVSKLQNFGNIDPKYKNLYFDQNNEYSVAYNVGMVGVIYNTAEIEEEPDSWYSLWDEKYKDNILMFDNPRDAFAVCHFMLGKSINTTDKTDWNNAAELLKQQKSVLQSYVMDEIYGKMETGEALIAPYYAGDYLVMLDVNEDLGFYYPKEGCNIFVDSVCVPASCTNYEAAMMYIDFLMEPEIALANAEYIGYASPNTTVVENPDYYYYQNEILYPENQDEMITEYFADMIPEIRSYYENLWIDVKLY